MNYKWTPKAFFSAKATKFISSIFVEASKRATL
jgi:hypothetical protein